LLSVDTNVLFAATVDGDANHSAARAFLDAHSDDDEFAVCELVLVELYVLLRNPVVVRPAATAGQAGSIISRYRRHPTWRLLDHQPSVMVDVWKRASAEGFARGRIFDVRLALGLRRSGVTEFATANVRHFEDLGFERVFDPLGKSLRA
jgi:toxin-antitoxin system PIN domain toxin